MANPKVGGTVPIRLALEAGKKYFWCSCGGIRINPCATGLIKDQISILL